MILRFIDNIEWGSIDLVELEESRLSCFSFPRLNSSMEGFYTRVFLRCHAPAVEDHFRALTGLFLSCVRSTSSSLPSPFLWDTTKETASASFPLSSHKRVYGLYFL
jgi:hypothetical protein